MKRERFFKKVYVSLPISGKDIEEVRAKAEKVKNWLKCETVDVITPFDVCNIEGLPYETYMARDIEALIGQSDTVYFCEGWQDSKGCRLEHAAAQIYGKETWFE